MSEQAPEILAAYLKANLRFLEREPGLLERMVSLARVSYLEEIRAAGRLEWLPWDYIVESAEALHLAAGSDEAMAEIARRAIASTFEEPFFRPIFKSGLVILGRTPDRLASWIPAMWRVISRGAGTLTWRAGEGGSGSLRWDRPPRAAFERPVYLRSVSATFLPLFELCEVKGRVEAEVLDGSIAFRFAWEPRPTSEGEAA